VVAPGDLDQPRAIEADPLHTVEARNNLAQILRDKVARGELGRKSGKGFFDWA